VAFSGPAQVEQAETAATHPSTFLIDTEEFPAVPEPMLRPEAGAGLGRHHTPRRLRPLARRRAITCLPRRVLMRTRKPWVFFRLRLLGWNVRFMVLRSFFGVLGPGQRATSTAHNETASFIQRKFMLLLTRSTVNHTTKGLAQHDGFDVVRAFFPEKITFAETHCSCVFQARRKNFLISVEILC